MAEDQRIRASRSRKPPAKSGVPFGNRGAQKSAVLQACRAEYELLFGKPFAVTPGSLAGIPTPPGDPYARERLEHLERQARDAFEHLRRAIDRGAAVARQFRADEQASPLAYLNLGIGWDKEASAWWRDWLGQVSELPSSAVLSAPTPFRPPSSRARRTRFVAFALAVSAKRFRDERGRDPTMAELGASCASPRALAVLSLLEGNWPEGVTVAVTVARVIGAETRAIRLALKREMQTAVARAKERGAGWARSATSKR